MARELGSGRHFDYDGAESVLDELGRASAGGPADYSGMNYRKIERSGGVFWPCPDESHPGTPRMFADGFPTLDGRARFHDTLFVPFHWGGRQAANRLTNPALDPVSRMPEFKVCATRIETPAETLIESHSHSSLPF